MRAEDPWKNRSEGMRCKTCMYYVPKEVVGGTYRVGRCRRHAPTMSGYPVVFETDWCGDHKLDETTLTVDVPRVESSLMIKKHFGE